MPSWGGLGRPGISFVSCGPVCSGDGPLKSAHKSLMSVPCPSISEWWLRGRWSPHRSAPSALSSGGPRQPDPADLTEVLQPAPQLKSNSKPSLLHLELGWRSGCSLRGCVSWMSQLQSAAHNLCSCVAPRDSPGPPIFFFGLALVLTRVPSGLRLHTNNPCSAVCQMRCWRAVRKAS